MRAFLFVLGAVVGFGAISTRALADDPERVSVGRVPPGADPGPAAAESRHDRTMGTPPLPVVEGAPACQVDQLSLLARVRMTHSRSGATLVITAKDPKQTKTVQSLVKMLDECIQASNKDPRPVESANP